jgi:hypothetical protein
MNIINKSNYKGRVINDNINVGEKEKEKEKSVEKYSDWREYVLKRQTIKVRV